MDELEREWLAGWLAERGMPAPWDTVQGGLSGASVLGGLLAAPNGAISGQKQDASRIVLAAL